MARDEAKEMDTLYSEQKIARNLAWAAWRMLFEESGMEAVTAPLPASKLQQMIDYEKETVGILQDIVETLPKLGT